MKKILLFGIFLCVTAMSTVDEDASVVKNLILYVPGDCVLLYLEGKLSIDSFAQIAF